MDAKTYKRMAETFKGVNKAHKDILAIESFLRSMTRRIRENNTGYSLYITRSPRDPSRYETGISVVLPAEAFSHAILPSLKIILAKMKEDFKQITA